MKLFLLGGLLLINNVCQAESFSYHSVRGTEVHGNWFAVKEGLLLTAGHNVNDVSEIIVKGVKYKRVAFDKELDLAIMEGPTKEVYELSPVDPAVSDEVVIEGSQKDGKSKDWPGLVKQLYWKASIQILLAVSFDSGISGSPVLLNKKVVGIAVAGIPDGHGDMEKDRGLIVPVSVIREFLRRNRR